MSNALSPVPDPAPLPREPCRVCREQIPVKAEKCTKCGAYQRGSDCRVCGALMREGGGRCGECQSFQTWWRRFVSGLQPLLALLIALFTVIGTLGPQIARFIAFGPSTQAVVVGTVPASGDARDVFGVSVTNSGYRPAVIRNATLVSTAGEVDLEILNRQETNLLPGASVLLKFAGNDVTPDARMRAAICRGEAAFLLQTEEQRVFGVRPFPIRIPLDRRDAIAWLQTHLPGGETACK
jgi:hypothetical protein